MTNPFEIQKKQKLKTGRRLGDKKSDEEYITISTSIKVSMNNKIKKMVEKNGNLSRTKIISDCLDKNL